MRGVEAICLTVVAPTYFHPVKFKLIPFDTPLIWRQFNPRFSSRFWPMTGFFLPRKKGRISLHPKKQKRLSEPIAALCCQWQKYHKCSRRIPVSEAYLGSSMFLMRVQWCRGFESWSAGENVLWPCLGFTGIGHPSGIWLSPWWAPWSLSSAYSSSSSSSLLSLLSWECSSLEAGKGQGLSHVKEALISLRTGSTKVIGLVYYHLVCSWSEESRQTLFWSSQGSAALSRCDRGGQRPKSQQPHGDVHLLCGLLCGLPFLLCQYLRGPHYHHLPGARGQDDGGV